MPIELILPVTRINNLPYNRNSHQKDKQNSNNPKKDDTHSEYTRNLPKTYCNIFALFSLSGSDMEHVILAYKQCGCEKESVNFERII